MMFCMILTCLLVVPFGTAVAGESKGATPSFQRDVRPLLAKHCFACHGPDAEARQGDLQLDIRAAAFESGVIDLESPAESTILERILTQDPDLQMPPPDFGKPLTDAQRQVFVAWVAAGAEYEEHWAFLPPRRVASPQLGPDDSQWTINAIDGFLLARMRDAGLQPNPEADRYTLIRRLYQDLVGLIPTPAQADAFVRDKSPLAYEQLVDQLLASPRYGEHWARAWLDLARYADTNGYEKDRPRSIWPYRDWVVEAINRDRPFDQFSIEQLAGDMLPAATIAQRVATGFHRNTMLNEEGGIDPLEYRFYAMVDRVATTGTIWMGLTVGCAQCHSHKYDPISHEDFYQMLALLNNADEPDLQLPTESTLRSDVKRRIAELEKNLLPTIEQEPLAKWIDAHQPHASNWLPLQPSDHETNLPKLETAADGSVFASGDFTKRDEYVLEFDLPDQPIQAIRLEALPDQRLPAGGPGRTYYEGRKGLFFLSELALTIDGAELQDLQASDSHSEQPFQMNRRLFDHNGSTGWSNGSTVGTRHVAVIPLAQPIHAKKLTMRMLFERHFVAALGKFRVSVSSHGNARAMNVDEDVETLLANDKDHWSADETIRVKLEYLRKAAEMTEARQPIDALQKRLKSADQTLVLEERPADNPRLTFRHHRGEWLSPREEVQGQVPAVFEQLAAGETNRLGFAKWLVSKKNPLFARVVVNRAWRQLMGRGLVRSDGDFGTQASLPTHPELLDWLACEFQTQGLSTKWLHRQIVMSAAYRQASDADAERLAQDPENRYWARGPRHRVSGELIRDMAMVAGECLSTKFGGPSVRPPQPSSVTQVAYGNPQWNSSTGEDRFRRSLYTFSKRTAPFAAFRTFDAPSGEACVAKRDRSNTPLQALTLLNDAMFVELARLVGQASFRSHDVQSERLDDVFRRLLTRPPRDDERELLAAYYQRQLARFGSQELSAKAVAGDEAATSEQAALVMVARLVMNLDEMIVKH